MRRLVDHFPQSERRELGRGEVVADEVGLEILNRGRVVRGESGHETSDGEVVGL